MTRPISLDSLTSKPAAGYNEPFGMMEACHERLHRTLGLLDRLRAHMKEHGADDQAQQAARDVMRYFDQAAPQHHHDEELHVFPPLLAQGNAAVAEVVRRLQRDHVEMEGGWARARAILARVGSGELQGLAAADEEALEAFASLYASHIEAEEKVAYPAAKASLDAATVAAMGEEMSRRRGIR